MKYLKKKRKNDTWIGRNFLIFQLVNKQNEKDSTFEGADQSKSCLRDC